MVKIPQISIVWLSITAIILALVPIVYFLIWKKKGSIKPAPLFAGMLGFLISARVLEMIPHMFCIVYDNPVSRFINGNVIAYMLYGAFMAGIFEECGRYVVFRYILKKDTDRSTSITYGIGHGGFEVYIISFAVIANYLTIAIMLNVMGADAAFKILGVTEANKATFETIFQSISAFSSVNALLAIFERVLCVGIHIALSVIVFYGVRIKENRYLFLAILAHAILDMPAALSQKGAASTIVVEAWLAICLIVFGFIAKKLYDKLKPENAETVLDNKELS